MEDESSSPVSERAEREYAAKEVDETGSKSAKVEDGSFPVEIVDQGMEDKSLSAVTERAEREDASKEVDESGSKSGEVENGSFSVEIVEPPRRLKRGPAVWTYGPGNIQKVYRRQRQSMARMFNMSYHYGAVDSSDQGGNSSDDLRTLIWSGGSYSWPVASSGITWVAVHGEDSICVVIKEQEVDKARFRGLPLRCISNRHVLQDFMRTIINEMEDSSSELHQKFNQFVENSYKKRSFAAVSVALGSDVVLEESGHEVLDVGSGAQAAIKFLREEIENDPAFTQDKTLQTAISALQRMHKKRLKARDIVVEFYIKGKQLSKPLRSKNIKEQLAVIRKNLKHSAGPGATNMEVDEHFHREQELQEE